MQSRPNASQRGHQVKQFSVGLAALSLLGISMSAEAATIVLDGDSAATGSLLSSQALVTSAGTVSLVQNGNFEFITTISDVDFVAAGAVGNQFDIIFGSDAAPLLAFDFDVSEISFIYGGNGGGILVEALDINGLVIDSFLQADTGPGQPAGPATLSGAGIRGLRWNDTDSGGTYAALDNIVLTTVTAVPEPGTIGLMALGLVGLGFASRRAR